MTKKLLIATLLFLVILYLSFPNAVIDTRSHNPHDAANYLLAAESIAYGKGFGPDFADGFVPMLNATPLFPLLLVPIVRLFDFNFLAIKLWMLFLACLTFPLVYFFFRKYLPSRGEALFALAFFVASPVIFGLSHEVLTEIPFMGFFLLATWAFGELLQGKGGFLPKVAAVLFVTLAFYMRFTALSVLLGGWCLWLHPSFRNRKQFKELLWVSVWTTVLIAPVFYRSLTVQSSGLLGKPAWFYFVYQTPDAAGAPLGLSDLALRIKNNLTWGVFLNPAVLLIPPFYFFQETALSLILSLPVFGWVVWRWGATLRQNPRIIEGVALVWMGTLLLFTTGHALRYLTPLFPFMILYGIDFARSRFPKKVRIALASCFLLVSVASSVIYAFDHSRNPYGTLAQKTYAEAGLWAREHLGSQTTYFAPMPHRWQVLSRGKAYRVQPQTLALIRQGKGPEYLLTFREPDKIGTYDLESVKFYTVSQTLELSQYVQDHPEAFTELYHNQLFVLHKRR